MTENPNWLPDSAYVGRWYCPFCEPDADPTAEVLETRICDRHTERSGSADDHVNSAGYLSGSAEAGDESNRLWCAFFHRGKNGRV